ncbi:hypothetical protein JB92DRAFT_778434 [Gautieria morchelliformis]|nr:hypothetical protein JB92DRAFT_778434 [Gautieria morchelliformis]
MLGTFVMLVFISAATCSSTIRDHIDPEYIPLSAPLPNGTMVLQCPLEGSPTDCLGTHGCCSNDEIQGAAMGWLCGGAPYAEELLLARVQHDLNTQIALCHFDGHSADNVQLLLTPNASAILDSMNRQDEGM